MSSTKLGYRLDNVKSITHKATAILLEDLLEDSTEFLKYFRRLLVDFKDYVEEYSKDGSNTWNKNVPDKTIQGLSKFVKEYHRVLRPKIKEGTEDKYVIIKYDLCSLQLILYKVDRLVYRTSNTIGLYLADYYLDKDSDKFIEILDALIEDMEQNLKGMVSMLNLMREIITEHNRADDN